MNNSFIIHKNYFVIKRDLKNTNSSEFLLNFSIKELTEKYLFKVLKKMKSKWHNCNIIFIYICDKYSFEWTNKANISTNHDINEHQSYPMFDFTRDSKNVSIDSLDDWNDVRNKAFITSSSNLDWDFYELPWILQKFESGLGIFDPDSFFVTPTYMKDLLNSPIHYDLVLYYIRKYVNIYSKTDLHNNYYGLYLFYKDSVGRALLKFFYLETIDPSTSFEKQQQLIQRIHHIYHNHTPVNHPFRLMLFYQSKCVSSTKSKFQINRYILIYLSFYGMYIDAFFLQDRHIEITKALSNQKNIYLKEFFLNTIDNKDQNNKILSNIQPLYDHYNKNNLIWISKRHVKEIKTPLFQFLYQNWDRGIRRNISLWDYRCINYSDTQTSYGNSLLNLFPKQWNDNFSQKDYDFQNLPSITCIRRKKKL